jgi:hypothetical protein
MFEDFINSIVERDPRVHANKQQLDSYLHTPFSTENDLAWNKSIARSFLVLPFENGLQSTMRSIDGDKFDVYHVPPCFDSFYMKLGEWYLSQQRIGAVDPLRLKAAEESGICALEAFKKAICLYPTNGAAWRGLAVSFTSYFYQLLSLQGVEENFTRLVGFSNSAFRSLRYYLDLVPRDSAESMWAYSEVSIRFML